MNQQYKDRLEELIICALLQGFGKDLKPLYSYPVLDAILYFKLTKELKKELGIW